MTGREIFDRVKEHLLMQGEQAVFMNGAIGNCAYRSPTGLRCAVGCLITDEFYRPEIEGQGIKASDVMDALSSCGIDTSEDNMQLLSALQHVHDAYEPSRWNDELDRVERTFFKG